VGEPLKRNVRRLLGGHMKTFLVLFLGLTSTTICCAQDNKQPKPESSPSQSITQKQIVALPLRKPWKPKLTLQDALKLTDTYIAKEQIDISAYYLLEARFILYGSKDNPDPSWFFWWVHEDGASGHYVEIVVSIKTGSARRLPSM
jgi:hypothetical protein